MTNKGGSFIYPPFELRGTAVDEEENEEDGSRYLRLIRRIFGFEFSSCSAYLLYHFFFFEIIPIVQHIQSQESQGEILTMALVKNKLL